MSSAQVRPQLRSIIPLVAIAACAFGTGFLLLENQGGRFGGEELLDEGSRGRYGEAAITFSLIYSVS